MKGMNSVLVAPQMAGAPGLDFETWETIHPTGRVPHPRDVLVFVARVGNHKTRIKLF
jgi:hypothetical protein